MQLPSIEVYLSWPQANYLHPTEVRGPAILALTYVFIPLIMILVALRIYTRARLTKNFGPDDIAIVAALFPTLGCATMTVYAVKYMGWDRHLWDVPIDKLVLSLKLALVMEVLFSIACSLTRLSILLLVLRVMATGRGILRRLAICSMVFICVEEFVFCVVVINTCRPVSDYWTLSFEPQQCINEAIHILAAGIINTFNDFCVVLIPIPVVLKLRLPLRQRICCAMLFGTGFIVCIAGGTRIAYMYQLNTTYDKTWLSYPSWICGTIELYLGIMATTIPAIKPLITHHFPNILGHGFTRHGQRTDGHFQSLRRYSERTTKSSPLESTSEFGRTPSPRLVTNEEDLMHAKSKPVILSPAVSVFSAYEKDDPTSATEWKGSPSLEAESSKTSRSSLDAKWTHT